MDKSPAYENFMNKMASMQGQGKPKMSATTMKIGSGSLEKRVANNETKITLLKKIFKAQKQEIGEKITPKVNTLEQSLIETTNILGVISQKLQVDISQRIQDQKDALENQRKLNLLDKRNKKEEDIEAKKKVKKVSALGKAVMKPFGNIFDKIAELGMILGTGILGTNLIRALQDEDFQKKLKSIFDWTTKNWKTLAIAGGVLVALDIGFKLFGAFKVLKFAFGILTAPVLLKALAIAAFAYAAFKIVEAAQENQKIMNENFREQKVEMQGRPLDEIQQYNFDQALNQGLSDQPTTFGAGSITGMYTPAYIGKRDSNFDIFAEYGAIPFGLDKKNFDDFIINKLNLEEKYKQLVADKVIDVEVIDNGTIDLSNNNQIRQYKENNLPANEINTISSMNGGNPYMEQVPELFGFADLVYA
tara:strand:- start:81 stop:1334 length:1254 start_codon:yes stop_codon:yes gene_type:complete